MIKHTIRRVTSLLIAIILAMPVGITGLAEEANNTVIVDAVDGTNIDALDDDSSEDDDSNEVPVCADNVDPEVCETNELELGGEDEPASDDVGAVTTYWFLVNDELYSEQTVGEGEALIRPDDPEALEGMVFSGWFLEDGTQLFADNTAETALTGVSLVNVRARFEAASAPDMSSDGEAASGDEDNADKLTGVDVADEGDEPTETGDTPVDEANNHAPVDADAIGKTNPNMEDDAGNAENSDDTIATPEMEGEESGEDTALGGDVASDEDPGEKAADPEKSESDENTDGMDESTLPVRVAFTTVPEDAEVTVRPAATEGNPEPEPIPAQEDSSYLLLPGEYTYSVSAEGYVAVDGVVFTVAEEVLTIAVSLEPSVEAEEEAAEAVVEVAEDAVGVEAANGVVEGAKRGGITYLDKNGETQTAPSCSIIDEDAKSWTTGWYAVASDINFDERIEVAGSVNLILCNARSLTAERGIHVAGSGNSLTIYGQSNSSGGLYAGCICDWEYSNCDSGDAGIGGSNGESGGTIEINGGFIKACGGGEAAGIGGGYNGVGGTITINGGTVEAIGGDGGAGIGGGWESNGGTINITGGEVRASTVASGAGIGGGYDGDGGNITISGGVVNATGGANYSDNDGGAGIGGGGGGYGGTITIGGNADVTAHGGASVNGGAGIGGGCGRGGNSITINGGTVNATGNGGGAGIGGGYTGSSGTITIGGNANVTASSTRCSQGDGGVGIGNGYFGGGAGIGGGFYYGADRITINGGTVEANGAVGGAGIGGGWNGYGGSVTINGGTVKATGEDGGAGIGGGGGEDGAGGTIIINGGQVEANGGTDAPGLGSGKDYDDPQPGTVSLGWTDATDFIKASSYKSDTQNHVAVTAADAFVTDETMPMACFGVVNDSVKDKIAGKKLVPANMVKIASGIQNGTVMVDRQVIPLSATGDARVVTLTATPATGYTFDRWSVTDADGNAVEVTNDRFTMPASDVTVSAAFGHTVTVVQSAHGTISADKAVAAKGETVTLTATPAPGYTLVNLTVKRGFLDVAVSGEGNVRTFTMPVTDVVVTAVFARESTVKYIDADGEEKEQLAFILEGSEAATILPGGWFAAEGEVNYPAGIIFYEEETHLILADGCSMTVNNPSRDGITAADLYIYGQTGQTGKLNATAENKEHNGIDCAAFTVNGGVVEAGARGSDSKGIHCGVDFIINDGSVTATAEGDHGYGIRVVNLFTVNDGTVNARAVGGESYGVYSYSIDVNGGSVTAVGEGKDSRGLASGDGGITISGGTVEADATGDDSVGMDGGYGNITLGWTKPTDSITAVSYSLSGTTKAIRVGDGQYLWGEKDGAKTVYSDVVTDRAGELAGVTLKPANIFIEDSINGSVSVSGAVIGNPYCAAMGTTVILTLEPAEGYAMNSLTVTDAEGNPVEVEDNRFTMLSSTVTVSATFSTWKWLQNQLAAGGKITLENDYRDESDDGPLVVPKRVTANLDLNGHTINRARNESEEDGSVITVEGSLTVIDGSGGGVGRITGGNAPNGGGVYVHGGAFTMSGGSITGNTAHTAGAGVYAISGVFTMAGGAITGNTSINESSSNRGGGVCMTGGTFTMAGGEISNNVADYGGGVRVEAAGTMEMTGGEIKGNTARDNSGGVYFGTFCSFTLSGGTISNNSAEKGGGVWFSGKEFTMEGGVICDNTAINSGMGGGVYMKDGSFNMTAGTISRNTANMKGGGVYMEVGSLNMSGGTIGGESDEDRNDASNGGGVYMKDGSFNMTGGAISHNNSNTHGGGVYMEGGNFTLSGKDGVISGNNAMSKGGGVIVDGSFALSGGSISDNQASGGGGLFVTNDGTFEMSGGSIDGNTANVISGGGVFVYGMFEMTGGSISNNHADSIGFGGGGVFVTVDSRSQNPVGSFTLSAGEITGNSSGMGGGVFLLNRGSFEMSGGHMTENTGNNGAGVYVGSSSTFTLSGGDVSGNVAATGGGVYVPDGAEFTMSGGSVIGNYATSDYAGGVYVRYGGVFNLSGPSEINGNLSSAQRREDGRYSGRPGNVVLWGDSKDKMPIINIGDTLLNDVPIGIRIPPVPITPLEDVIPITGGLSGKGNDLNFASDVSTYAVGLNAGGEAVLSWPYGTFHANDGSDGEETVGIASGTGITTTLRSDMFTRAGRTFKCWNTEKDGTGDIYNAGEAISVGNEGIELYAQWYTNVTLTANSGAYTYDGGKKTVSGFASSVSGLNFPGVTASGSGVNPGTYPITFSGVKVNKTEDSTGEYLITKLVNGTLTINPAPAPAPAPAVAPAPAPAQDNITIQKVPASVKAKAKKNKVTVSWKKIRKTKKTKGLLAQIKGIEVQYSTDPGFASDVNTKAVGKKKTKAVLKLRKKTTYYVRVRYVGADGVSNWSKVKRVKTK